MWAIPQKLGWSWFSVPEVHYISLAGEWLRPWEEKFLQEQDDLNSLKFAKQTSEILFAGITCHTWWQ